MKKKIKDIISKKISGEWGTEAKSSKAVYVIRTANFENSGEINYENLVKREIDQKKIRQKALKAGDIIIEKSGGSPNQPVGRVVYFDPPDNEKYLCNNFTSILRPKEIFPRYFFYALFYNYKIGKVLRYQNKTTGIINLKLDKYLNEEIEIPSYDRQIAIASVLDKAQFLLQKRHKSIEKLNELLRATFLEMFGDPVTNSRNWDTKILKNVTQKVQIGPFGSQLHRSDYIEGGIPLINPVHIRDLKINPDTSYSISEEKYYSLPNYHLQTGDVILARRGEMGRCGVITEKENGWFCGTGSLYIRLKKELNPYFLAYTLSSMNGVKLLEREASGITMLNLNKKIILNLSLGIPPIILQKEFERIFMGAEQLKYKLLSSQNEIEILFQSLLQKIFRGEIKLAIDQIELSRLKQSLIWFRNQLNTIVSTPELKNFFKKWDSLEPLFENIDSVNQWTETLSELDLPNSSDFLDFQKRFQESTGRVHWREIQTIEEFEFLIQDDFIKSLNLSDNLEIPAYEKYLYEESIKQEFRYSEKSKAFLDESNVGKQTLKDYGINIGKYIFESFEEEVDLEYLKFIIKKESRLAHISFAEIKNHFFALLKEYVYKKCNGAFFFQELREMLESDQLNTSFDTLKEFVETSIHNKEFKQVYYPGRMKKIAPKAFQALKAANAESRLYLVLTDSNGD